MQTGSRTLQAQGPPATESAGAGGRLRGNCSTRNDARTGFEADLDIDLLCSLFGNPTST